MKINIEGQYICVEKKFLRGIPNYIINLLKALCKRNNNSYSVSFFDKDKERNNRYYIESALGDLLNNNSIFECNELDFREIMRALRTGDASSYNKKKYGEYFGINADVYHFPSSLCVPQNVHAPMVVTVHDMIPVLPNSKHELNDNIIEEFKGSMNYIKNNNVICICDSCSTKNDLQYYFDIKTENVFVVPLGFFQNKLRFDNNKNAIKELGINKPYLLYLGALDPRKGVEDIITSYETIRKIFDIQLVLAGTGEKWAESELKPKINRSQYKNDIILTGYVTEQQKCILLSLAEMFVFPSEYEGFGLPVLEAMSCGTPVITTNVSSIPEVGGDAVLYIEPHNCEQLSMNMMKLLDDEKLRKKQIEKGIAQCKKFSWDKTAELTEKIYNIAHQRR